MTHAQRLFYRRRYLLWIAAALLALGGGLTLAFLQIGQAEARASELAAEADRRGDAVSTLATDVRTLRAQIKAKGETPAAPDPGDAVADLPARAEVPVPIPGPPGPKGVKGDRGPAGPAATPVPGPSGPSGPIGQAGQAGQAGADSTVPGPAGPKGDTGPVGPAGPAGKDGASGKDGAAGRDGRDGQACPAGYSLQPPPDDPDGLMCRRNSPSSPDPAPSSSPTVAGLPADRRRS